MNDDDVRRNAIKFVRKNHKDIVSKIVTNKYTPVEKPASFFMAGSPGAGKTELSIRFIEELNKEGLKGNIVRIDADEIREKIPGYTGSNSNLFQGAASLAAEKVHDYALNNNINLLFDDVFIFKDVLKNLYDNIYQFARYHNNFFNFLVSNNFLNFFITNCCLLYSFPISVARYRNFSP